MVYSLEKDRKTGIGECGILRGLSIDDRSDYEDILKWTCYKYSLGLEILLDRIN